MRKTHEYKDGDDDDDDKSVKLVMCGHRSENGGERDRFEVRAKEEEREIGKNGKRPDKTVQELSLNMANVTNAREYWCLVCDCVHVSFGRSMLKPARNNNKPMNTNKKRNR